jgi:hypothetical protein
MSRSPEFAAPGAALAFELSHCFKRKKPPEGGLASAGLAVVEDLVAGARFELATFRL